MYVYLGMDDTASICVIETSPSSKLHTIELQLLHWASYGQHSSLGSGGPLKHDENLETRSAS